MRQDHKEGGERIISNFGISRHRFRLPLATTQKEEEEKEEEAAADPQEKEAVAEAG